MTPITVRNLHVSINGAPIIRGVDLNVPARATVAIVGESGSGKSMTAKAISGLLPRGAQATGTLELLGNNVDLSASERSWEKLRGQSIVWLPQDPFLSLNPLQTCGKQISLGSLLPRGERRAQGERLLADVGLDPRVYDAYPHELSGGMRQRVAIACALAPEPKILIADEPTTALDASTQEGVLDLLRDACADRGMTLLIITHDLALAAERAQYLVVFHDGRVVEEGPSEQIVHNPASAYTRELLDAHGRLSRGTDATIGETVLSVTHLVKQFDGAAAPSVDDVSFEIRAGEILGLVGESGSGKSTVARCITGLETLTAGSVLFHDAESGANLPWSRGQAQLVFQNPYGSLNPTMTIRQTLVEALHAAGKAEDEASVLALMQHVGLEPELADRRPGTLSGGQCQRAAIARALAPEPRLLIADEAITALDANIQTHVLETLLDLRQRLNLAILFISHDLDTVRRISDRIAVMQHGKIVETGSTREVMENPTHPYVRKLIAAMPAALDR